jgi:hypothetical protein
VYMGGNHWKERALRNRRRPRKRVGYLVI